MEATYKTDLNKTYMIVDGCEDDEDNYQYEMLRENKIQGIIDMEVRHIDNQENYYYDVSGKTSIQELYERSKPGYNEIKELTESLLNVIHTLKKYMLNADCIILDPQFIFTEKGKFFFCYYPVQNHPITNRFHELTEFLVREVDYKDEQGVHLAYVMHKATMETNYSLEQIMRDYLKEEREEKVEEVSYVRIEEAREDEVLAEKKDIWEPIRRWLEKTRLRL